MKMIAIAAALLAATSANAAPTALKDYALGSTLDAFKTKAAPPNGSYPTRVVCSDQPDAPSWLTPPEQGEVACSFEGQYGGSWARSGLPLNDAHSATVEFDFFGGKLVRIEAVMDATATQDVDESLAGKFGKPSSTAQAPFQVRSGATFPQSVKVWSNGTDRITLKTPDYTTERMSVTYVDAKGSAEASAAHKPASIM